MYVCECVYMNDVSYVNGVCIHVCICVCVYAWCIYIGTYATGYLWKSEDNLQLYVGFRAPTVICSLYYECLQPLSHAASPRLLSVTLDGNSF